MKEKDSTNQSISGIFLTEQERFFLDNILEIVLFFNKSGIITIWSKQAQEELGYQNGNLVLIEEIFRKDFCILDGEVRLLKENDGKTVETVAYRKNQTCFPVKLKTIIQKEDNFVGICFAINLSVKVNAERRLEKAKQEVAHAMKVKNEFVANITHELRTPVNGMMGLTKNLLDTELNSMQLESIHIMERCCFTMTKIINSLLDFSKLEAGKFTLDEQEFSFYDFVNRTMAFNVTLVNEKGLKLIVNIAKDIPDHLIGDELRLTQILNNLISNAVKFTQIGHIIVEIVKTAEDDKNIELFLMVMDTGIGIAENDRDKLFKSFSQVDASITRKYGGTGLGLVICKELVELMGGEIHVESEPDKGSTFSFSVRLKKAVEQKEERKWMFPSGKFIYQGPEQFSIEKNNRELRKEELNRLEQIYQFGTRENIEEIKNTMNKLIICLEMGNWEKAENFAGIVKKLISDMDKELKRMAFRLELSVRKEDYQKSMELYEELKKKIDEVEII